MCLLLNSRYAKFPFQTCYNNSNVLAVHPFLFLSAAFKERIWKYPQPGVHSTLTPFGGTISCWFLSPTNTPCFSFIKKMNTARRQCFSATRPRTDAAVWGSARVSSVEIIDRARLVHQTLEWKMRTRKLYKIGHLMVCSFAVNRISGVTKRSSSSGGLTFEWNRFPLQTKFILSILWQTIFLFFCSYEWGRSADLRARHNAVDGPSEEDCCDGLNVRRSVDIHIM